MVDLIVKGIMPYVQSSVKVTTHSRVVHSRFDLSVSKPNVFKNITANTPDASLRLRH